MKWVMRKTYHLFFLQNFMAKKEDRKPYIDEAMHQGIIDNSSIFHNEETMNKAIYGSHAKKIYCYEDAKTFPSILETSLYYGISSEQISYALKKNNGAIASIQKTFVRYNELPDDFSFTPRMFDEKSQTRNRWIYQYDMNKNLINIYKRQSELPSGYCATNVNRCCNGKRRQSYGFIWSYVSLEDSVKAESSFDFIKKG